MNLREGFRRVNLLGRVLTIGGAGATLVAFGATVLLTLYASGFIKVPLAIFPFLPELGVYVSALGAVLWLTGWVGEGFSSEDF